MIKVFFDVETTGVNPKLHSIHQLAGCIEVNGEVVEYFDIRCKPYPKAQIDPGALKVCNVTEAQIMAYPDMKIAYKQLILMLSKYIDKFDTKNKAHLVGFNNRFFDDVFLRVFFELNGDLYIGSWFYTDSLDCIVLASQYLLDRREGMQNFKQGTVAKELGIEVDKTRLHDARYDVELLRKIYRIVTGLDTEF